MIIDIINISNTMNIIGILPNEILDNIFYYCDLLAIRSLMQCDKHLYNLIDFNYFVKLNTHKYDDEAQYEYIQISRTTKLKHGVYKLFYSIMREVIIEAEYKYGKYNGVYSKYDINGRIAERTTYIDNQLFGMHYLYYNNGTVCQETEYKHGYKDGICKMYYTDGSIFKELMYKNDKPYGIIKVYNADILCHETPAIDGIKHDISIAYYSNGKIRKLIPYNNDKIDGIYKIYLDWNDNNYLFETFTFVGGIKHGPNIIYYENGKPYIERNYVNNERDKSYKEYYKTGILYKSTAIVPNTTHIVREEYYESGNIKYREIYAGSIHIETTYYKDSDKII